MLARERTEWPGRPDDSHLTRAPCWATVCTESLAFKRLSNALEPLRGHLRFAAAPRKTLRRALGGRRHDRCERGHVPLGENGRHRAALPAPGIAVGGEQAVADGGTQHPQHDLGLRVIVDVVEKDAAQCGRILDHVPVRRPNIAQELILDAWLLRSEGCSR